VYCAVGTRFASIDWGNVCEPFAKHWMLKIDITIAITKDHRSNSTQTPSVKDQPQRYVLARVSGIKVDHDAFP
jgi:hypothetical protein